MLVQSLSPTGLIVLPTVGLGQVFLMKFILISLILLSNMKLIIAINIPYRNVIENRYHYSGDKQMIKTLMRGARVKRGSLESM